MSHHASSSATVVTVSVNTPAMKLSLRAVCEVLAAAGDAAQGLVQFFPDLLDAELGSGLVYLRPDAGDLILGEPIFATAGGAFDVTVDPTDRYLELVSAIARDLDATGDIDLRHGWPILSSLGGAVSIADAAQEITAVSAAGEGA